MLSYTNSCSLQPTSTLFLIFWLFILILVLLGFSIESVLVVKKWSSLSFNCRLNDYFFGFYVYYFYRSLLLWASCCENSLFMTLNYKTHTSLEATLLDSLHELNQSESVLRNLKELWISIYSHDRLMLIRLEVEKWSDHLEIFFIFFSFVDDLL